MVAPHNAGAARQENPQLSRDSALLGIAVHPCSRAVERGCRSIWAASSSAGRRLLRPCPVYIVSPLRNWSESTAGGPTVFQGRRGGKRTQRILVLGCSTLGELALRLWSRPIQSMEGTRLSGGRYGLSANIYVYVHIHPSFPPPFPFAEQARRSCSRPATLSCAPRASEREDAVPHQPDLGSPNLAIWHVCSRRRGRVVPEIACTHSLWHHRRVSSWRKPRRPAHPTL